MPSCCPYTPFHDQSSTTLWEALEATVMDTALSLHNGCVRGLLPKHGGYECHTEGDSFIIAFPTAAAAVAFALELQVGMRSAGHKHSGIVLLLERHVCSAKTLAIHATRTGAKPSHFSYCSFLVRGLIHATMCSLFLLVRNHLPNVPIHLGSTDGTPLAGRCPASRGGGCRVRPSRRQHQPHREPRVPPSPPLHLPALPQPSPVQPPKQRPAEAQRTGWLPRHR